MGDLDSLIGQTEPLDAFDRERLEDWLHVLEEDCETFGATSEDMRRMTAINRRLRQDEGAAP